MSIRILVVAGLLASLACAHRGAPVQPFDAEAPIEGARVPSEGDLGTQSLFRVRYGGPKGDGGLRLILRLDTGDRFQLVASDLLGRAVWSMDHYDRQVLLVDHGEKTYCVTGMQLALPEEALEPLPVEALPNVLLGYLPVAVGVESVGADGAFDFTEHARRRWTGHLEAGRPSDWMLWEKGRPVLWWTRQGGGGILSHHEGVQFRWRKVVSEPLASGFERLTVPDGYAKTDCYESHL